MRIGIVIDDLDRRRGGMSEWCWRFVDAAARRGLDLHVIAQGFGLEPLPPQVSRHRIARTRSRLEFARAASDAVRPLRLDVVHDMGLGWNCDIFQPHGGSYAAWIGRRLDMYPALFRVLKRSIDACLPRQRDFARHGQLQTAALKEQNSLVVALSNSVANDLNRLQGIRADRIRVIHNGVDCRRFSPDHRAQHRESTRQKFGVSDGETLLLLAAHNFRLKGVPELLDVTARLSARGRPVHVAIAGGRRLERWRASADRRGLAGRVTFVGMVTDMAPLYAAADVYVHPSYYDPCSLVLLEAAASGLPIVTTRRFNGAVEVFRDGDEILTVGEPSDVDGLFEHVQALFDERLRNQLAAAARQVALRNPIERNMAEVHRLYDGSRHRVVAA